MIRAIHLHGKAGNDHATAGSSGVPDHFGQRFSQPASVTATVSSWRIPSSPVASRARPLARQLSHPADLYVGVEGRRPQAAAIGTAVARRPRTRAAQARGPASRRVNAVQGSLTIDLATANGTALVSDNDYIPTGGTRTFSGTALEVQTITVTVNDYAKVEADETFYVNLSNIQASGLPVTFSDRPGSGDHLERRQGSPLDR
jgi:hypothetical protein